MRKNCFFFTSPPIIMFTAKLSMKQQKKKTLLFNVPKTFLENVLLYYVLTNTMPIIELDQSD